MVGREVHTCDCVNIEIFGLVLEQAVEKARQRMKVRGLGQIELRGFRRQDACHLEVSEDHFRGSIESLVVGALESVALDRRAGQCVHFSHKVCDDFRGHFKRVVVQELIDPEEQIQQGAEPCEPGIAKEQISKSVRGVDAAVDTFVGESFRRNQGAIERHQPLVDLQHGAAKRVSVVG